MNFWTLPVNRPGLEPNCNTRMDMLDSVRQPTPGCLHLGATWTYKKKRTRQVHPDSPRSYTSPLHQPTHPTHRMNHIHHSRRYTRREDARVPEQTSRQHTQHTRARRRRAHGPADDAHRAQPPSKGSLRGSKCTPLCNSQLPACKPIVCRRSQVSKSYIDAEQRRQRSSISILAVRRRARALSSRSDQ